MKKKKTTNMLLMILVCIILSACGQEQVTSDTEELDFSVDGESREDDQKQEQVTSDTEESDSAVVGESREDVQTREIAIIPAEKADIQIKANENGRALTAEELQLFDEFLQERCNYGFLLSVYDTPADADLNEIFYNGLGADQQEGVTEDELQAYLDETGYDEVFLDFNKITATQLNDFLLDRTGLSYDQMNTRLNWTYLPEYDAYYWQHGDTNIRFFNCEEGYTVDEKLFVLQVAAEHYGDEDGYHDMRYELVLEKNGETYQFRSNRLMMEEGLIEDQSFQVSLSPMGDVIFASYEPNTEEIPLADVTFYIIKDGWKLTRLYGPYSENIRETDVFNEIEDIAFADYDEDGIADIIMILNYSPVSDADASYSEVRVYKGGYYDYSYGDYNYFQQYQPEISETLTAELSEKTISAVLDHLATILPDTTAD
ncbi:MAG: hypothetical protein K2K20_05000 [Lachnospiraceae bacterium]|nr:hypothetical protein [Lachnospiraceae bacterium]